jgi:NADP-dependent 3-hydroxy acid dehydrogenase YdfG
MSEEDWKETIDTNLTGVFNSVKASVEALKKSKGIYYYHRQSCRHQLF